MSKKKEKPSEPVHPTIQYIEDVCKKASELGYTLNLNDQGFVWKNKNVEMSGARWMMVSVGILLLEACIYLEQKENLSIVLT